MASRYNLSDKAWDIVADLFVDPTRRGQPRRDDRKMLNGILWVLCSGAPWRDMLDELGPWSSVYQRFRDWRNQRVFDQMLKRLQLKLNENGQIDLKTWMIDSTAVRASRSSAGAGKKGGLMSLTITL
ncbi:transposase [Pseudomonas sp. 5]|nr:transposase [Pseudomonas sp. 5]